MDPRIWAGDGVGTDPHRPGRLLSSWKLQDLDGKPKDSSPS
jgi:hypothetical protein